VGAAISIGMHFGTFPLAHEGMHEPVQDLKKARQHGFAEEDFFILSEGLHFLLGTARKV